MSCLAVPSVLRQAIGVVQPGVCFGLSLGLTFLLNIVPGIPLYAAVAPRFM